MSDNPHPDIERAGPADAAALFDFLVAMYAEDALQPLSSAKIHALVDRCTAMDRGLAGVVRSDDTPIVASIGLTLDEFDYTDHQHLHVRWLYVHPSRRRENHATRLVEFAKWAQEGMQEHSDQPLPLFLDIATRAPLEPKLRLMQRSAPQVGALFSWGGAPTDQFDQLRLGNGRGSMGRNFASHTHPERTGTHRPSTLSRARA